MASTIQVLMSNCNISNLDFKEDKMYRKEDLCSSWPRLVKAQKQDIKSGISFACTNNQNKMVGKHVDDE